MSKLADTGGISTKNPTKHQYFKAKRLLFQKELGRMIVTECLSNSEIAARTGVPIRTVERWISQYYAQRNREILDATSPEPVLTAMNRARDRLERHRKRMIADLESDVYKDASLSDKAALWGLVAELELIDIKLVESAPEILARRQGLPNSSYSLPHLMSTEPTQTREYNNTPVIPYLFANEKGKEKQEEQKEQRSDA